jgi:hypothetical protein
MPTLAIPLAGGHSNHVGSAMSFGKLDDFGGYQKSLELFDLVVEDTSRYMKSTRCERLVS